MSEPTDDIGVWISGFFGSGKSHFLKILSHLLENSDIAGKPAIDYFEDKIGDPYMYADMKKCCSIPTESILFNIDVKSTYEKDRTAVLKSFTKVFYEHLGYFGENLKVALFEQYLDRKGKLESFKTRFEEIHGDSWEESRDTFEFWQEEISEAAAEVLNTSVASANNWFENNDVSGYGIDSLINDIKKYIDKKGDNFRLIFCVDELGQFMGENTDLILNAQSIVEEIGTKCEGRVWVIVTSQEAIDEVTKVKAQAYSKIQGRFKTRLSLTSSSVDEVIKKRILAKNEDAELRLKEKYEDSSAVLKNLITFHDAKKSFKGYSDENDFTETYPFIPYQFNLFQDVLTEIRKHGNTGAHHSSGERSMLSGFQEVAQCLNDKDDNALVPFYLFYDSVNTFLESTIRRVITRCEQDSQNRDGIEEYDVAVLKLLYLIKYIKDIPSTVDNIATLMADDINVDKLQLKEKVKASLDRLLSQNYIGKNGNTYSFLTDDEQDVEREIKNIVLDSSSIITSIHNTLYQDLFTRKAIVIGENTIGFDKYVDDNNGGGNNNVTNSILLRVITAASDYSRADDAALIMKSQNGEAICVLSDEYDYYNELESALKIIKYTKTNNISSMPEAIQDIVQKKRREATTSEKAAKELLSQAIINGTFYINGEKVDIAGTSVEAKFNNAMTKLIESVYSKMGYIKRNYKNDAEILEIFNDSQISFGNANPNAEAFDEVAMWIDTQAGMHRQIVMVDVLKRYKAAPYGWNEADIAAVIASLIVAKRVNVVYGGAVYQKRDERLVELLRKKSEVDKTRLEKREEIDAKLIKQVKDFLMEYLDLMNITDDEDELAERVINELDAISRDCNAKISNHYTQGKHYPGVNTLSRNATLIGEVLKKQKDRISLFRELLKNADELLDLKEDREEVYTFIETQRPTFEKGYNYLQKIKDEETYLESISEATEKIAELETIINSEKPYRRISEIPALIDDIDAYYNKLLEAKRTELQEYVEDTAKEIVDTANGDEENPIVKDADNNLRFWKKRIDEESSIFKLDAMKAQIDAKKQGFVRQIFDELAKAAALAAAQKKAEEQNVSVEEIETTAQPKIARVSRTKLMPPIQLKSIDEIEKYTEMIKNSLIKSLADNDGIQIL